MPRDWDLDDVVTLGQICAEFHVTKQAASMWPRRYPDFPQALISVGRNTWYSHKQVTEWHARQFPPKPRRERPVKEIKGPRGECSGCGRMIALVGAGLVRRHAPTRWDPWCSGSQLPPKAVPNG